MLMCICWRPLFSATPHVASVQILRSSGLEPLVRLLQEGGADAQANAAGAIQSICFQARPALRALR